MLKKIVPVLALALALLCQPLFAADELVNGIDGNFAPFAYIGPDGKAAGFDVDALNWIAEKQGFKVSHQAMEWASIVTSLKDKKTPVPTRKTSIQGPQTKELIVPKNEVNVSMSFSPR